MKSLIVISALLLLTACSKEQVNEAKLLLAQTTSAGVSPLLAVQLECAQPAYVQEDVTAALAKVVGFEPQPEGLVAKSVGSNICVFGVTAALPVLAGAALDKLPARWECTATKLQGTALEAATELCNKIK